MSDAQPLFKPMWRNPINEFSLNRTGARAATNSVEIKWTKKHMRVTLIDVQSAATSANCRVSDNTTFSNYIMKYFPVEGVEFENFSNIYHGQDVKRVIYIEIGTGQTVHVAECGIEEWD